MQISRFIRSFIDAGHGLKRVFRAEQNFRVQILCALLALIGIVVFPLERWETILVILLITMVLTMELVNSAAEYLVDLMKPRLHGYVQSIKDIMAGAVLLTSLSAIIVGIIIFYPHFIEVLR